MTLTLHFLADGQKLYFASDREGGFGGMDLYVSTFSAGKWSAPENLGSTINTPGNELFPFIYDDGTLYFASDGWGGLGGLDNFYVEKKDEFMWGEAINLDKPFNSNKDDFGYILNVTGTEGYFTSAREDGLGKDDIYSFKLKNPQGNKKKKAPKLYASVCTFDEGTGERLPNVKVNVLAQTEDGSFTGFEEDFLMSLKPTNVEGEYTLTIKRRDPFDEDGENGTYTSDANGDFSMNYKPSRKYILVGKMEGYKESRQEVTVEELANGDVCIPMIPAQCISLEGIVMNRKFGKPIPGATITLVDLCTGETSKVKSDAGGNYQFPCLPCGCDFVVNGEKTSFKNDNGLVSTVNMTCEGSETLTQDLRLMPPRIGPNGELEFVADTDGGNINTSPNGNIGNPRNPNGDFYTGGVYTMPNGDLPRSAEEMLKMELPSN